VAEARRGEGVDSKAAAEVRKVVDSKAAAESMAAAAAMVIQIITRNSPNAFL